MGFMGVEVTSLVVAITNFTLTKVSEVRIVNASLVESLLLILRAVGFGDEDVSYEDCGIGVFSVLFIDKSLVINVDVFVVNGILVVQGLF